MNWKKVAWLVSMGLLCLALVAVVSARIDAATAYPDNIAPDAVKEEKIQRVADVHAFPGHIACDSASNSEIVLPVRSAGRIVGVLDIDSPVLNRFSEEDEKGLSDLVMCIGDKVDFDGLRG